MKNINNNKILWAFVAIFALIAALAGVANQEIYDEVISKEMMPGVLAQDLITIVTSIILLFLTIRIKEDDLTSQMVILGILGYVFYGYGIFVIERLYNALYFVYMVIFGLSFYSIVYSIANIRRDILQRIKLSKLIRFVSVGFLLLQPLIFYPLWISQLLPLIKSNQKIEFLYSIYILDICFIMPAFIIVAIMTAKQKSLGLFLTPVLLIKGFTLLLSVAIGGLLAPIYQQPLDAAGVLLYLSLSLLFLVLVIIYFRSIALNRVK